MSVTFAPLKRRAQVIAGQSPDSSAVELLQDGLPFLQGNAEFGREHPSPRYQCDSATKTCWPGDVLISVRAPVGAVNVADQAYGIGRGLAAVRSIRGGARFLKWALENSSKELQSVSTGSTFEAISRDDLGNIKVPLGDEPYEERIAEYLDRETAKIDELIRLQRQLIDGLKTRRNAFLSLAFAECGDNLRPLKRLLERVDQGVSPDTSASSADASLWVLKAGCSNRGIFNPDESKSLPDGFDAAPGLEVKTGDLIVSRASGSPGLVASAAIVKNLERKTILSDKTFRLVVREQPYLRYLYWYMNSPDFREQVLQRISGADGLANNIPLRELRNIPIPMCSPFEAEEVAERLDRETVRIDTLIAKSERMIKLSQERRAALITAAVTGQIDIVEMESSEEAA